MHPVPWQQAPCAWLPLRSPGAARLANLFTGRPRRRPGCTMCRVRQGRPDAFRARLLRGSTGVAIQRYEANACVAWAIARRVPLPGEARLHHVAQTPSTGGLPALGAMGRRFDSFHPDHPAPPRAAPGAQRARKPPSTGQQFPVTNDAVGELNHRSSSATFSGRPGRPMGSVDTWNLICRPLCRHDATAALAPSPCARLARTRPPQSLRPLPAAELLRR